MTVVLTLTHLTPPPRFDDLPWTVAILQEATSEGGTYTPVEQFDLDPVDTDPEHPLTRSFTTELATVGNWYRILWEDEDGDQSEPTPAVQNVAGVEAFATAAELAAILRVDATANADALARVLLAAAGEITMYIGRSDLAGWELALAAEVNLERATEHWQQMKSPFGILGLGSELPMAVGTNSWQRHADKLVPLKAAWGLA